MCRFKRQAKNRVRHSRPWSIPPRATKNHNSPLVGLFSFRAWRGWPPLEPDIPRMNCPLKGHVN